jgi:HK97 family phage prohead protease
MTPPLNIRSLFPVQATAAAEPSEAAATIDFICSTGTTDRTGEIIDQSGWLLDAYRRNPVFQNAHRYGDVMHTLGRALITDLREQGGKPVLFQRVQFAIDINPVAKIAFGLYKGGFLNAVSVGFRPIKWEYGTPEAGYTVKYTQAELLEVSAVAIPANPEALALGLKSGAFTQEDLATLAEFTASLVALRSVGQQPPPEIAFLRALRQALSAASAEKKPPRGSAPLRSTVELPLDKNTIYS